MAISKITWENKEGIQNDESIARKNKVMDDDMNEIKQVVNNNADELSTAQSNIEDLQSGQSTSNADITSLKNRVSTLETDNKTNKSDISALKSDNATNKSNISTLQEQVSNKVDKVEGKGLSTNDYTTEEKQKLAGLKNYDDTEIKQNIADIKEEQETQNTNIENLQENDTTQDELIEKLQQENENIKNALINVETEQAKSLHIGDASTVSAQLSVEGKAEQETQEGTDNLAILEEGSTTKSGVIVSIENGNITTNGQNETESTLTFEVGKVYLIEGETYYIKRLGVISYTGIYVNNNETQVWGSEEEKSFVANKTGNFGIVLTVGQTAINNLTQQILISKTSGAEWEEGKLQIPSPINPSKIKCLGGNKNYFNKDTVTQDKYLTYQNQEVSNSAWTFSDYIECKPNEQWIISGYTAIGGAPSRCFYDANKSLVGGGAHNNQESMMKFTTPANCYYFRDSIAKADIDTVKIEKGDTATSYSSYGQGSTEIKKINKNLYKPIISSGSKSGITYSIDEKGIVELNGTATAQTDIYIISSTLNNKISKVQGKIVSFKANNSNFSLYGQVTGGRYIKDGGNLLTDTEEEIARSFLRIPADTVCNNLKVYPQIEIGEITEYAEHQEENYILDIQQEMLQGDYFVKEEDGWKEVHGYVNKKLNSTDSWSLVNSSENSFKFRLETYLKFNDYNEKCTNFKTGKSYWNTDEEGCYIGTDNRLVISIPKNNNYNVTDLETFKTLLSTIDATLYYYNATLTKLPCTEEQSTILDELNNLDLFDGTNNIITTEDIALLKLKYVVDTKTYIDNQINERLSNIENQIVNLSGGN